MFFTTERESVFPAQAGRSRSGQFLADLAHRYTRPVSGDAEIGDRRKQGVLPEVISPPPFDRAEQAGLGPAAQPRRHHGEPELAGFWPRNAHSGRNPHQPSTPTARRRKTRPGRCRDGDAGAPARR
jgi:hypothetical protein